MRNNSFSDNFTISIAISIALHLLLIYVVCFGLPIFTDKFEAEEIIVLELLPASNVSNVKKQKVVKDPIVSNQDAKKVEKNSSAENAPEIKDNNQTEKEPVNQPKIPEPENKPEPVQIPESKPEDEKKEAKPKEATKEQNNNTNKKENETPKPEIKKPPVKKSPNDKEIESLLKNLEQTSDGNNNKSNNVNREKSDATADAFGNFDDSKPQSLTNDEIIRQQIIKHWNQPIASTSENISITLFLSLLKDGSIEKVVVSKINCPAGRDNLCRTASDSVLRAVKLASPLLNLAPDDYNTWHEIKITFHTNRH